MLTQIHLQKSPTHAQKSPTHAQKSPTHAQKSPTHAQKIPTHAQKSPTHAQKSPTHAQKSPTHAQKSLYISAHITRIPSCFCTNRSPIKARLSAQKLYKSTEEPLHTPPHIIMCSHTSIRQGAPHMHKSTYPHTSHAFHRVFAQNYLHKSKRALYIRKRAPTYPNTHHHAVTAPHIHSRASTYL